MASYTKSIAARLIPTVTELRNRALLLERTHEAEIEQVEPSYRDSARNLLHYLALRQTDIRQLQIDLSALGLSSLGRSEAHTLDALHAVLRALHAMAEKPWLPADNVVPPVNFKTGRMTLQDHSQVLLGSPSGKRSVRIMVTMPSNAATDPKLVRDLLAAGMDVMRINCAHDGPEAWLGMITNLRQAERELGRSCKIYADLSGPKLRTGPLQPVGRVVHIQPTRDFRGLVTLPARVWLTPSDAPQPTPAGVSATLPLDREVVTAALPGDTLELQETSGRSRPLIVVALYGDSRLAELDHTAYFEEGAPVRLIRERSVIAEGRLGPVPEVVLPLTLKVGNTLVLTRDMTPGRQAVYNADGEQVEPACIPCTLDEAFTSVKPGDRVWFDDGKIGGRVLTNDGERMTLTITQASLRGAKLRAEKGINLPDSSLSIPALTEKDLADLAFMVRHADIVGYSFVRKPEDVYLLESHLSRLGGGHIGIVLKVENRQAFENLPRLLLAGLASPPVGVMVARGDLAVEVGFERLAEVQEEILWLSEAAHVPVIWATQVLEGMATKGAPSRAEVSDAVMSGRAECVMLNKGPFIVETVRFLSGILERMDAHQSKKRAMLRRLAVSEVN